MLEFPNDTLTALGFTANMFPIRAASKHGFSAICKEHHKFDHQVSLMYCVSSLLYEIFNYLKLFSTAVLTVLWTESSSLLSMSKSFP